VTALLLAAAVASPPAARAQARGDDRWVGTWATAVVARLQGPPQPPPPAQAGSLCPPAVFGPPPGRQGGATPLPPPPLNFSNQTLRQIVHVSLGGDRVRVVLSNAFGTAPLAIGAAHVALRASDAADAKIDAKSDRPLTFSGSPSTAIAAGAIAVSDPVSLSIPAFADLAVDIYLPSDTAASTSPLTTHAGALQTNYVSNAGNFTGAADFPVSTTTPSWFFLARVEVAAPLPTAAVVAFGDSITDGTRSTPNTNSRWPDDLAKRLAAANVRMAVLNEGIAGNRVLCDGAGVSALARFDRDVLVQPGATHVIVLESINDIGIGRSNPSPTTADLIAGHRQLIERAHARGLRIIGATLTPYEGAAYATPEGEVKRQAVNEWIRHGKEYDGVIDFDAAVRDAAAPARIQAQFNPGDNLHMNDSGYKAMADAIDLALFSRK
jgi:lysophospholipase L1-like esterase